VNIPKAIENLEEFMVFPHAVYTGKLLPAAQLGIEALKRVKSDRTLPYPVISDLLPGETEEEEISGAGSPHYQTRDELEKR